MLTRTIEHAVNNTFGPRVDVAQSMLQDIRHDAVEQAREFRLDMNTRLEFGAYVIAGAILTGFVILAIFARTGD